MKSLDDARREASLAALAKARLKQAKEHRLARVRKPYDCSPVAVTESKRERVVNDGNYLRRCLNPDCNVWFATRLPKLNWCCDECLVEARENTHNSIHVRVYVDHATMVSKRNARIYDRPKPTPYAKALIAKVDAGVSAIDDVLHAASVQADRRAMGLGDFILSGVRQRGFTFSVNEPSSSYAEAWFLVGMDISAAFPNRPCDHSGFTILHSYSR